MAARASRGPFQLRPGRTTIGSEAAEQDSLLSDCFVATLGYELIRDFDDPHCILVGRSGVGKTAILRRLRETAQDVITISPRSMAFEFLSRSDLLRALRESDVHLDLFYQSLWRHIFVTEVLKHYLPDHQIERGKIQQLFETLIRRRDTNSRQIKEAAEYLEGLEPNFFSSTTDRVVEIHGSLERNMRAELKLSGPWSEIFPLSGSVYADKKTEQAIAERRTIAQQVVSRNRVVQLDTVVAYLDEAVVTSKMRRGYILIDDLDSNWVDDTIVYDLIRALMLEIFQFHTLVKGIKVVVALRDNILARVESSPPLRGYQREKLETQRMRVRWSPAELKELVDRRINFMLGTSFSINEVDHRSVLPQKTKDQVSGIDHILNRCYARPRDVIRYINLCLELSNGKMPIPRSVLDRAEDAFSRWRYDCLEDEWHENYPAVGKAGMALLADRPMSFSIDGWSEDEILDAAVGIEGLEWGKDIAARLMAGSAAGVRSARRRFAQVFYEVGMIGVRLGPGAATRFSYHDVAQIPDSEFDGDVKAVIHPALAKHLRAKRGFI